MRSPAKDEEQEVAASGLRINGNSNGGGEYSAFQGCVGLTCLKRLYEGVAGSPAPFPVSRKNPRDRRAKSFIYLQHRFNESQVTLTSFILRNTLSSV
ncbi:hypothetical protein BANRA_05714 [Klebsiella pneumoniae]|nr:hypothetical protein BANRA_05714 [Klebsiella pneumoniae]